MKSNKEIIGTIKDLMNTRQLSLSELARRAGVAKSSLSRYLNETRQFPLDKINDFARALNVSSEYLLGVEVTSEITDIYNQLNKPNQNKVYNYATDLLGKQNSPETTVIPLVGQTAAGAPIDYGDVDIQNINTIVPKGADYAITINGDSMEPTIKNGDIVFYKSQPALENGEIGIFEIQGEAVTCKKYRPNFEDETIHLESINKAYDDLVVSSKDLRILGKVIL